MTKMLVIISFALAYGMAWAVWRRTYGGGDGWLLRVAPRVPGLWKWEDGQQKVRRGPWLVVGAVLTLPAWFFLPPWQAGMASALMVAHWPDGHRFDRPWMLAGRYSYAPGALALILAASPFAAPWLSALVGHPVAVHPLSLWLVALVLVGPLTAIGYAVARMEKPPSSGQFFDGWGSWGEVSAGFALGSLVALALAAP